MFALCCSGVRTHVSVVVQELFAEREASAASSAELEAVKEKLCELQSQYEAVVSERDGAVAVSFVWLWLWLCVDAVLAATGGWWGSCGNAGGAVE